MKALGVLWTFLVVGFLILLLVVSIQLHTWWLTGFLTFCLCAGTYLGLKDRRS